MSGNASLAAAKRRRAGGGGYPPAPGYRSEQHSNATVSPAMAALQAATPTEKLLYRHETRLRSMECTVSRLIDALEAVNHHAAMLETRMAANEGGAREGSVADGDIDPQTDAHAETAQELASKRETATKPRKTNSQRGKKSGGNVLLEVSD